MLLRGDGMPYPYQINTEITTEKLDQIMKQFSWSQYDQSFRLLLKVGRKYFLTPNDIDLAEQLVQLELLKKSSH